jgi:hypothetical protein
MGNKADFDETKVVRSSDGRFEKILQGEILGVSIFTARTGTGTVPVGDLIQSLHEADSHMQDFTEKYTGKDEWAAMKSDPDLMRVFAGLELAHADADFRLTEKIMADEVLRHAVAGEGDSHDQKQHQDNLIHRLSDKVGARLRKVRQFGGGSAVRAVIADSDADLAAMEASGAQGDDRCHLYYAASLAHAQMRDHEAKYQLHEARIPGQPFAYMTSFNSMALQSTFGEVAEAHRSMSKAQRELFPYNEEF